MQKNNINPTPEIYLDVAKAILSLCETDLKRKLSEGECRDLLCDNTPWGYEFIISIVAEIYDERKKQCH